MEISAGRYLFARAVVTPSAIAERYISQLPVGMKKEIFEMVYLDGMTQEAVADIVGYSKGRVSQIISETIKD